MGAVADFIYGRVRGSLRFSKDIEDQIDPEKKKAREQDATGARVKRGFESQREMGGAAAREMEMQNKRKEQKAPGFNGVRG
jgi:hypothetical protein